MGNAPLTPSTAADASHADRLSFPDAPLTEAEKAPRQRTSGERRFDHITYAGFAGVVTFALSVATMYLTKHSENKAFFGLSDKSWKQGWKDLGTKLSEAGLWKSIAKSRIGQWKMFNFVHDPKKLQNFSESTLTTMALNTGGMLMMLPVNYAEHHKREFVHTLNEKFGKPGETEIGDIHVKNEPPQTLGSILTGRITAVATVLFSLTVLNSWITKGAKALVKPESGAALKAAASNAMGALEKWTGNQFVSLHKAVSPNAPAKRSEFWRHIGEISAIDAIATVAASSILYVSSKFYSRIASRKDGMKLAADKGGIGNAHPDTVAPYGVAVAPVKTVETQGIDATKLPAIVPQETTPAKDTAHASRLASRGSYVAEASKPAADSMEMGR